MCYCLLLYYRASHQVKWVAVAAVKHVGVSVSAAGCWCSQWRHGGQYAESSSIHLANGAELGSASHHHGEQTRRRFQSPLRLFNYAGRRATGGSAAVRLSALGWIRLWSPLSKLSHSIRDGTARDGEAAGSLAPGRSRWSEDNSSCAGCGQCCDTGLAVYSSDHN